jgi:tryptophan-rich sensory protein
MIVFSIIYAYLTFKPLPRASKLVWPYIAWISFATAINIAYYLKFR